MITRAWLPLAILSLSLAGSFSGCTADTSGPISVSDAGDAGDSGDAGQPTFTLSVLPSGSGTGKVTSFGTGSSTQIDCQTGNTQNCSAQYDPGSQITLTAAAGANSNFMGWSGACTGAQTTCEITMSEARSVTAQFNVIQDALQVAVVGSGHGTVTSAPAGIDCGNYSGAPMHCSETVNQGGTIQLTEAPQPFSQFAGWSGGGCVGTATTCDVDITQAESVTATFNVIPSIAPLVSSITQGAPSQGQVQAIGINFYIAAEGVYPSSSGSINNSGAPYIGQISLFAANVVPAGWLPCNGQLLQISLNQVLFSLIGTIYGGDGQTTFALPQLSARVPVGTGTMPSSSNPNPTSGASSVPLVSAITWGGVSQGQVSALGLNYYIALEGVFPSSSGSSNTTGPYLGQLMIFAGDFTPAGWAPCNGQLLSISSNTALFTLLGTFYGGDGQATFALPDLRARVPMGVGALSNPILPVQTPGAPSLPLVSSIAQGATAQGQIGALGMNYYIALQGVFPSSGASSIAINYVSELMVFAGDFAPAGWALCNGATLNISLNAALFNLIGTTYGGNGQTTFALPQMSARVPMAVSGH